MAQDYTMKQYIDPASTASLFQQQKMQEQQMRQGNEQIAESKLSRSMKIMELASTMTQQLMKTVQDGQTKKLMNDYAALASKPVPTLETESGPKMAAQAEANRQAKLKELAIKINPAEATKLQLKAAYEAPNKPTKTYQQSQMQVPDEKGSMQTYGVTFDTSSGKYLNPQTGKPITSPKDLEGLPERGYAQAKLTAGFTVDGQEIVRDARTGNKYVMSYDEKGNPVQTKYEGVIYPKMDNIPAGFSDSLSELAYSQEVLGRMTSTFNKDFVGPVAAKYGKMSKYLDSLTEDQKVEFYGNVAEYKNSIIKAITGAQMSEVEAKRIVQQIPDENASPKAFMSALKRTYMATQQRLDAKQRTLAAGGYITRGNIAAPEEITKQIEKKLGIGTKNQTGLPQIGEMFNGGKVINIKRIR